MVDVVFALRVGLVVGFLCGVITTGSAMYWWYTRKKSQQMVKAPFTS